MMTLVTHRSSPSMSATDDATQEPTHDSLHDSSQDPAHDSSPDPAQRSASHPRVAADTVPAAALVTLALAVLTGAVIGATFALVSAPRTQPLFEVRLPWMAGAPTLAEWPREPRAGESARLVVSGARLMLVVRAPRAPIARELAAGIVRRREAGAAAIAGARAQARARWIARRRSEPLPDLSPAAQRASLLLAAAQRGRDLAQCLPPPYAGGDARAPQPPPGVIAALARIEGSSQAADVSALAQALRDAAAAEAAWFAAGVPSPQASTAVRGGAWRAWQLERADSLSALATRLTADETALQCSLATSAAAAMLTDLDAARSPAYDELLLAAPFAAPLAAPLPAAVPLGDAWLRLLGMGALLGAIGAGLAAAGGLLLRSTGVRPALVFTPARDPSAAGPWLHLVAGPNATAVARATLELAAHALARGERVLVVDGGARLALHERFGREARWGLMECLIADMPVLGLVQYGGRPGFYLLAHGNAARGEGWASLGQRLDDAKPHFGRIVLALDATAPRAIGDSLLGRALEGWWAERVDRLPRAAVELTARLGIAFSALDLDAIPEVQLELLSARVEALHSRAPEAAAVRPEPVAMPAIRPAPAAPVQPVILDCDLQVLQRLRFLAWMRRVQSENRPATV